MSYLDDIAFEVCNAGPYITGKDGIELSKRDPSPEQIAERCAAIRRAVPREPQGPSMAWIVPTTTAGLPAAMLDTIEAVEVPV